MVEFEGIDGAGRDDARRRTPCSRDPRVTDSEPVRPGPRRRPGSSPKACPTSSTTSATSYAAGCSPDGCWSSPWPVCSSPYQWRRRRLVGRDEVSAGIAPVRRCCCVVAALYAGRALQMQVIAGWALRHDARSLELLFPLATRALPMLLLFVTFLFINTEVWMVASALDGGVPLGRGAVFAPWRWVPRRPAGRGGRPPG